MFIPHMPAHIVFPLGQRITAIDWTRDLRDLKRVYVAHVSLQISVVPKRLGTACMRTSMPLLAPSYVLAMLLLADVVQRD